MATCCSLSWLSIIVKLHLLCIICRSTFTWKQYNRHTESKFLLFCVNFAVFISSVTLCNELEVDYCRVLHSSRIFLFDLWDILHVSTCAWYDTTPQSHGCSCQATRSHRWRWIESRQVVWVGWEWRDKSSVSQVLYLSVSISKTC